MCDLIFSGAFERHPRLALAIVEFELASAPICSPRWTIPTASAAARRFTGSRAACARAPTRAYRSCRTSLASAALLPRPCTLLTPSELSFTFARFSASDRTRTMSRSDAAWQQLISTVHRVRPQGCTRDHRGRQRGGRRVAACSRRLSAADRGAGSLRHGSACGVSRLCAGTGLQLRHRNRDGTKRTGTRSQAGAKHWRWGGHRSGWPRRDGGTGERSPA